MSPAHPVTYFEIPVLDMARAAAFYQGVFSVVLEHTTIDGNQMALFPFNKDAPGSTGALACGESYRPSLHGTRVYFRTTGIRATLAQVTERGGTILYPVTSVGELGWVAEFSDSEGNCIALHEPARVEHVPHEAT
jgi:predicted enzyme related to lactoylglutathione lyase